jgi:hypothetical protein
MAFPHDGKKIPKGVSGNPAGRPPKLIKHTIKELQAEGVEEATPTDIKACYLTLINMSIPALEQKVKDQEQSALVRIVGKAILSGKGFDIIERMLDRSIGRAQQSIDHTTKGEKINRPDLSKLSDEELRVLADIQRKSGVSQT